jgi:hypothetical protein
VAAASVRLWHKADQLDGAVMSATERKADMLFAVALKRWETLAHGCTSAAVSSLDWNSLDSSGVHASATW